jgi:AraC-like DNA-binding protein
MDIARKSFMTFNTRDPDEFVERISGIAPGLRCNALRPRGMNIKICAAQLPSVGIFHSTLTNFRVQSPSRSFYGVTIPLAGESRFLVNGRFETIHGKKIHIQHPNREFDANMGEDTFESLQLCFDAATLDSIADKISGQDGQKDLLMETLDLATPLAQSFARHALFMWNEILRGGPILTSPFIAQESSQMLGALLISAAGSKSKGVRHTHRKCSPPLVQRAEDYLMENLLNPISIADVAAAARVSGRTLSREFRRHHGTTIKGFIKERRLEAANRALLAAEPGETNVTKVALDMGFDQLGRFSADYKIAFGELPSETLAR